MYLNSPISSIYAKSGIEITLSLFYSSFIALYVSHQNANAFAANTNENT